MIDSHLMCVLLVLTFISLFLRSEHAVIREDSWKDVMHKSVWCKQTRDVDLHPSQHVWEVLNRFGFINVVQSSFDLSFSPSGIVPQCFVICTYGYAPTDMPWSYQWCYCSWVNVSDLVMVCGGWLPDGLVLKRSTNMSTVFVGSLAPSQTGADPTVNLLLTWVCVEQNEGYFFFCLVFPQNKTLPQCFCGIRLNLLLTFTRMTFSLVSFCYIYIIFGENN